jgi:quercetin dioxygenase-like cupin family protein
MALPHAKLLDVVSVRPLGDALSGAVSTSLIKTERIQLLHMVLAAHRDVPEHRVDDECTLHCLEGEIEVVMGSDTRRLRAGELVVLPALQPHALRARTDSALLVTLILRQGDAGDLGGAPVRNGKP